jgi:UPF0755 protein
VTFDDELWTDAPAEPARRGPRRPPRPGSEAASSPATPEVDHDYVDLPPEGRVPKALIGIVVLAVALLIVVGGAWRWYQQQIDPPGAPGADVAVEVPEGATVSSVGDLLADEGVITNATIFGFWVGGKDIGTIGAGSYVFQEGSSFQEAVDVLEAGPDRPLAAETTKVSVPEGLRVDEIVDRIAEQVPRLRAEDLQAALDEGAVPTSLQPEGVTSYEGLLFPATYEIDDDDTAVDVLTMMAQEMETRVQALGIEEAAARVGASAGMELTPYDLLTIASLVQEEAGNPEEAPKIATVIVNRLREDWPLGIDATTKYLADIEGTELDFTSDSPYNTRTQRGLPPTPIAAPGEYALEAAFAPAEGPWMYYVLTDPGVHTFAVTDAEFAAAKQICVEKDLGCG